MCKAGVLEVHESQGTTGKKEVTVPSARRLAVGRGEISGPSSIKSEINSKGKNRSGNKEKKGGRTNNALC